MVLYHTGVEDSLFCWRRSGDDKLQEGRCPVELAKRARTRSLQWSKVFSDIYD